VHVLSLLETFARLLHAECAANLLSLLLSQTNTALTPGDTNEQSLAETHFYSAFEQRPLPNMGETSIEMHRQTRF
jgi:hypothetical protein